MNFRLLLSAMLLVTVTDIAVAQTQRDTSKKYVKVPAGYLMVLRQGDNLMEHLEAFAQAEKIPSCNFTGMGFVNATFGFYNRETKNYDPKEFNDVELASMHGSIAWQDGKPSLHVHGVVTDKTFAAYGGHLLAATVGTGSLEIMLTVHDKKLQRIKDEALGANILNIHNHK